MQTGIQKVNLCTDLSNAGLAQLKEYLGIDYDSMVKDGSLGEFGSQSANMYDLSNAMGEGYKNHAETLYEIIRRREQSIETFRTAEKEQIMSEGKMRFGCLVKKGVAEVRERDLPEIGEYDVLLKMKACNICTTDYGQWLGLREHQGYPMAGGHEAAGIVQKVGSKVADFKIGDLVATGYEGCGNCSACRNGQVDQCEDIEKTRKTDTAGASSDFQTIV